MIVDVVVDVGNTRIKWGRCQGAAIVATAALEPDDPADWQRQHDQWQIAAGARFVLTGVHPRRRERLADWLRQQGDEVRVITEARELPLRVLLERPEQVGMDRLLNAVAVNARRIPLRGSIIIDAGSAVTVDWVNEDGAFCGGTIFPGIRLMALALHEHTALLPMIEPPTTPPPVPGTSTRDAIAAGVVWAVVGGVRQVAELYERQTGVATDIFLTGGDGPLIQAALGASMTFRPDLTLEGIRLTAESLP